MPLTDAASTVERLRAFWNLRYAAADFAHGTAPNTFLASSLPLLQSLPANARVLADGEGRNGVWLAGRGFRVTALDVAVAGLRKAQQLAAAQGVQLETGPADVTSFDLGRACWDAIVSIFLHLPAKARRALHRRCITALRPGGVFLFEAYGPGQLALGTGGPKEAALLPALSDVEADFASCPGATIIHHFHGLRTVHEGAPHHGDGEVVQLIVQPPVE